MKISVIITTYNRPDTLEKTIDGLFHQMRPPDEVIIADDGSGFETLETVRVLKQRSPVPLIHVWQEDAGFQAAKIRNKALRKAEHDYIVIMDGDCVPDPWFIYDHEQLSEEGCFFQGKRVLVGNNLTKRFTFHDISRKFTLMKAAAFGGIENGHHIFRLPFLPAYRSKSLSGIRSCNMGFFRKDIYAVNGFNEDFQGWGREDSELVVRFYRYGLLKKTHPFMAICYHLYHAENDKKRLDENDALLKKAINGNEYVCINGLDAKINSRDQ